MNRKLHSISAILFFSFFQSNATVPYISIRSQATASYRDLMGWTDKVNLWDMENLYIVGAATFEATRSFDADALTHCLFGALTPSPTSSDELIINVSGSQVPGRGATDWLADYFGLSTTYQSTLFFKPRVSNLIIDFSLYVGLDEWVNGLYFRVHAPVVATRWDLNFHEEIHNTLPLQGYPAGYFSAAAVSSGSLTGSVADFLSDRDVPTIAGITFEPLDFAQFEQVRQTKTALAEIQMALGYNFLLCPCYHLGLNFRVYAPTGNRPEGIFVFEPIAGNGKHWEVGLGYTGHYTFWESEDEESTFGLYSDGNFTHQCRATQTRTFDLKGKPNSRYMLAERLGAPANPPNLFSNPLPATAAGSTVPSAQFNGVYTSVANLTTFPVHVSSALQVDITALFDYTACGLSIDLGYNLWARTCEKITINEKYGPTRLESGNVWALKGDAFVIGFPASDAVSPAPASIPLSATQSGATITSGTNLPASGTLNLNIDNAQFAMFTNVNDADQIVSSPGAPGGAAQQLTSNDSVFLSNANVDIDGGRTSGLSHTIFAHLNYTWCECDEIVPYVGIGGKAEFGPRHKELPCNGNSTACIIAATPPNLNCQDCGSCQRCNLSEWGVWIKGGIFWS